MSVCQPVSAVPSQVAESTPPRVATIPLRGGGEMRLPCPSWCTDRHDHGAEHPVDITHTGRQISVTLPVHGGAETVLRAQIVQAPFADEGRAPSVVLWPCDDGEPREGMTPADLDATIAMLAAHVDLLRAMRNRLVAARDEHEAGRLG